MTLDGRRCDDIACDVVCVIGGAATSAGETDFGIAINADETARAGTADAPVVRPPHDWSSSIAVNNEREVYRARIFFTRNLRKPERGHSANAAVPSAYCAHSVVPRTINYDD